MEPISFSACWKGARNNLFFGDNTMHWVPEKLCSSKGDFELLIERFKNGYHCEQSTQTWKWRVIRSGVVMSQGTTQNMESAQQMAEANLPA